MRSNIAAVILAAGESTRFGRPKQLVTIRGQTLVELAVERARAAGCTPIVTVVGANERAVRDALETSPTRAVTNEQWRDGIGSSISAGFNELNRLGDPAVGALILLVDQPLIPSEHLRQLCEAVAANRTAIAATRYSDGRAGVPAAFSASLFSELRTLRGDQGAQSIIAAQRDVLSFPANGLEFDVDEPMDLERCG